MFESNPTIRRITDSNESISGGNSLTFAGVINRTGTLLLVTGVTFALTWNALRAGTLSPGVGLGAAIIGLILALVITFARVTNPFVIGTYALTQGVILGVISYFAHLRYPGIALQAVAGTMGTFFVVLWLYSMRVLRATPIFVKVITAALIGILALYLVDMVAGMFGHPLEIVRGNSNAAIAISSVIVLVAALSFVIDFHAIETAVTEGVDSKYGWYFAFSLLVGLVYLYIQILSLLSKLRGRD